MRAEFVECSRKPLVDAIVRFLGDEHAAAMPDIRAAIERAIDESGPDAITAMGLRLAHAGRDWEYYPCDPLARRIHLAIAPRVLQSDSRVTGVDYLGAVAGKPLVMFANHLSYGDANVVDVLLRRAGASPIADRLTAMAGPKVYSSVTRRFSSLCFGTIKTPQNAAIASGEAVMSSRDVAEAARRVIAIAHERLTLGEALLVFPEGSRSRTGTLQPFLPGVARYLDVPGTWAVPMALTGTEKLFPVGHSSLTSVKVTLDIGEPMRADALRDRARGNRRAIVETIRSAVATLLPEEYRS